MKLPAPLLRLREHLPFKSTSKQRGNSRVAVVHWDREQIHYFVVSSKSKRLKSNEVGSVPHADIANPFLALANHFRENSIQATRLVVLLSRPELDMLTLNLPPADANELPVLVASEVEQQLGESEEPPIVDYFQLPRSSPASDVSTDTASSQQVIAFALPAAVMKSLQTQLASAGFRAAAICSRHLSPLGILRRRHVPDDNMAVTVHLYAGEAEIAICHGAAPILLRSIRISVEDPTKIAEQIWLESQRCLALLPSEVAELPFTWFVFTTCDEAWKVARALEDRDQLTVQPIDPLIGWEVEPASEGQAKQTSAANAGAAWDFISDELSINLLAPKRPPKAASPMTRWIAIGSAAVVVVGLGTYFLLSDINQLRDQVQSLEAELIDTKKVTAKYQEKADQVASIETWLADQVDWGAELNELSKRLPDGESASVRRLTATANGKNAVIDLAVQVANQETISQFENSIRSAKYAVTSKQISQNPDSIEYPWQFETRIAFPIEVRNDVKFEVKQSIAAQQATTPENDK